MRRRVVAGVRALLVFVLVLPAAPLRSAPAEDFDPVVYIENAFGYLGATYGGNLGGNASGSGFVVDPRRELGEWEGASGRCPQGPQGEILVVTNEHVVRSANELDVTFLREEPGGAVSQVTAPARIVRMDAIVDLALLTVDGEVLRSHGGDPRAVGSLRLWQGEPGDLQQGAAVAAMGSPLGLKRSVSRGVVSAPQQEIPGSEFRLVQTDAAVNPGNSGGPLVLLRTGEVVGVNSAGFHSSRVSAINLAVPARRVRIFLRQALCDVDPRLAGAPVLVQPVDERIRSVLGLPEQTGAVVLRRIPVLGMPETLLEEMDVVLEAEGKLHEAAGGGEASFKIGKGGTPFDEALLEMQPDSTARFRIWRRGRIEEISVPLGGLENAVMDHDHYLRVLGGYFQDVPADVRVFENFGGSGALLGEIMGGTPASDAGLRRNDVLQAVLVRAQGKELETWEIEGMEDLARIAPDLEEAVASATRNERALMVGFQVYNLNQREHAFRFLRIQQGERE